jgi:hypothetical protein
MYLYCLSNRKPSNIISFSLCRNAIAQTSCSRVAARLRPLRKLELELDHKSSVLSESELGSRLMCEVTTMDQGGRQTQARIRSTLMRYLCCQLRQEIQNVAAGMVMY